MAHQCSPAAEPLLQKEFKVLDKGFVRLVDYLGTDLRIVETARVSYGQSIKTEKEDKALIDYLIRNHHTSPFEQVVLTFQIKMPLMISRHFVRHRTARINEVSGRYTEYPDEFYVPSEDTVCFQSTTNKQCRGDRVDPTVAGKILDIVSKIYENCYLHYSKLINMGIAKELSRILLPPGLYTVWYWQMDLHNLMNFLRLRMASDAQYEIREYAKVIFEITKTVCPWAMEAFEEHILNGVQLSCKEKEAICKLLHNGNHLAELDLNDKELLRLISKLEFKSYE